MKEFFYSVLHKILKKIFTLKFWEDATGVAGTVCLIIVFSKAGWVCAGLSALAAFFLALSSGLNRTRKGEEILKEIDGEVMDLFTAVNSDE